MADRQSDTVEPPLTPTSTQWPSLHKGHFFGGQSIYIDSFCSNLPTMAIFFGPQGGRCREVQLYIYSHNVMA